MASKKNKDPSELIDEAIDISKVTSSENTEKVTVIETEAETVEVVAKGEPDFSLQIVTQDVTTL